MSRYYSYLNTAVQLLLVYKGEEPFAIFLKKYFSQHKKHGSKDRRQISHLCYCYFRLGKALPKLQVEERVLTGLFLCTTSPDALLEKLKPEWNKQVSLPLQEKIKIIGETVVLPEVFPWREELSSEVDRDFFAASFFVQPNLYLRLRPGKEGIVKRKLQQAGISFAEKGTNCLALSNAVKADTVLALNEEAVVQDYSSQQTGEVLTTLFSDTTSTIEVWDCCAASGGKSIMLKDILGNIRLTVSDIRESILANLKKRFAEAGINNYQGFVADLSKGELPVPPSSFDLVVADVPCSGSGTWSRTPEQLYFFDKDEIASYSALQKKITQRVFPALKPGGYFLYITCSVFKQENEEVVAELIQKANAKLVNTQLLKGYDKAADTLFAALLQRPSEF